MTNRGQKMETVTDFIFLDSKFTADGDCGHKIRINKQKQTKKLAFWKKSYYKPRQLCKKQRHNFADKGLSSQTYGFSSCHVWMRELDYKKADHQRIGTFKTAVLEKTLETPLDYMEIQPVNPKGNQSRLSIGRTDAEAKTAIFWPPDVKN